MKYLLSPDDREFQAQVESCEFPLAAFDHRAHLRLAYVYLCEQQTEAAYRSMHETLKRLLERNDVDLSKFHETMTRAWILAVRHFIESAPGAGSADEFIDANPTLLDSRIMLTHYSAELLYSDAARAEFVEPDLDPIPRHDESARRGE